LREARREREKREEEGKRQREREHTCKCSEYNNFIIQAVISSMWDLVLQEESITKQAFLQISNMQSL
jgi:hypothetical protein